MKIARLIKLSLLCVPWAAPSTFASPRTSANYSIPTEVADGGGSHSTSAAYTNDGSAGVVVGFSTVASPSETAKIGYIGQLYEVTAVQPTAAPATVNEGTTRQLAATATFDDATTAALLGNDLSWSVVNGPLTGISSSGLATAGNVYEDTAATVQGSHRGVAGTLGLTVLNVGPDDFGSYAADGIADDWQVQFFGLNNPLAAPAADADGTGQNNLFKFTAGLNPTDRSVFLTSVAPVTGVPTKKDVIFTPLVGGRTYSVEFSDTLVPTSWQPLTGFSLSDNGTTRTITDNNAPPDRRFYRVVITKP